MEDKAEKNAARAEKRRLQAEAEEAFARENEVWACCTPTPLVEGWWCA